MLVSDKENRTRYDNVAKALGAWGSTIEAENSSQIKEIMHEALEKSREKQSALINVLIGKTDFREGSISKVSSLFGSRDNESPGEGIGRPSTSGGGPYVGLSKGLGDFAQVDTHCGRGKTRNVPTRAAGVRVAPGSEERGLREA
ncbi:unnamed protein product [Caenorhabditis auriculariae]|uniref:Uncharacterized protein n=1 Tax=Caenorhabditis auriculariae TaxID=2777116 RepID=A0A8S1HE98_9PELO|nr:unnamed protein product [Caenorhabditis auriculariae]